MLPDETKTKTAHTPGPWEADEHHLPMPNPTRAAEIEALAERIMLANASSFEMWDRMRHQDCFGVAEEFLTARDEWRNREVEK